MRSANDCIAATPELAGRSPALYTLTVVQDLRRATNFRTELLLKVLTAVTKEATGDLGELLTAIVAINHDHGRKLDELLAIARR